MSRENAAAKGRRYLTEGRLLLTRVDELRIEAVCRGGGESYQLGFVSGRWRCSCPARSRCAHLVALQLVANAPDG